MARQDKRVLRVKEEATDRQNLGDAKGERTSQKGVLICEFRVMLRRELGSRHVSMITERKESGEDKERAGLLKGRGETRDFDSNDEIGKSRDWPKRAN